MTGASSRAQHNRLAAWLWLGGGIIAEATGSLSLRAAVTNPIFYAVVAAGFLLAFYCLARCLQAGFSLGAAYGIWGAAGVALTSAGAAVIYGEPFTALMGAGIALIIGGVLCIEFGARGHRAAGAEA